MNLKIIYQDSDLLVIDKPAGIVVFPEGQTTEDTVIDLLLEQFPELKNAGEAPRYGIVHRLDKDTSGILLVAKSTESLIFLQKQFSAHTFSSLGKSWDGSAQSKDVGGKNGQTLENTIEKRYIALVTGSVKEGQGVIHTLIGRSKSDPRKQTAHSLEYKGKTGLREAITDYKVLERFNAPTSPRLCRATSSEYTLLEVEIKTGRKHQIRCHLAYIHHPIAGDKIYGFKDSPKPQGLTRQFLHASYMKIQLPNGQIQEFNSDLPEELQNILKELKTPMTKPQ